MLVGPDDMMRSHQIFLGVAPTDAQKTLYEAFPAKRGVMSKRSPELLQAIVVMALVQTFTKKTQPEPFPVLLIVPPRHQEWVGVQLKVFAKTVFGRMKAQKAAASAEALGRSFKQVLLGCRMQINAPERWVSYGFAIDDAVPTWLSEGSHVIVG